MRDLFTSFMSLQNDRRAVTALEYGLIAALIGVAIISAVSNLGTALSTTFSMIASHFGATVQ